MIYTHIWIQHYCLLNHHLGHMFMNPVKRVVYMANIIQAHDEKTQKCYNFP